MLGSARSSRSVPMSLTRILTATALLFAAGIACAEVRIVPQDSGVKVRLRGISAVSKDIAWASGREGTVLRTVDGGKHWQTIKVPNAGELDFRDVEGFDADTAVVLSIGPGEASRVYRTEDGGKSWKLTLQNRDPRAFFDCMAFDGERGWMMGDPVEGRFQIYASSDAGKSWNLLPGGPKAEKGEAAFAASGTCIAVAAEEVVVVTGGSVARMHSKHLGGKAWNASDAYKSVPGEARGFFSVATSKAGVFMVGGDYKMESTPGIAAKVERGGVHFFRNERVVEGAESREGNEITAPVRRQTLDYAELLFMKQITSPRGYRSGAACTDEKKLCISVGPSGADSWDGSAWKLASDTGYDAVDLIGATGWASGDAGRIARIEITD